MSTLSCDVLMITYNRPEYTRLALARLLETCDEAARVWVWHNGDDARTLEVVESSRSHPSFYRFHHSRENVGLNAPTNWLWENASGDLVGKVDDDCLVPCGWIKTLRQAHKDIPTLGVVACWHFYEEDFVPELALRKIVKYQGGHEILRGCSVQGSGYLMKRTCVEQMGLLEPKEDFWRYCFRLAERGWSNGWYHPFLFQDHMDDPRSAHTLMRSDADVIERAPLSAKRRSDRTLADWLRGIRRNAVRAQAAPADPRWYKGWRWRLHILANRVRFHLGVRRLW